MPAPDRPPREISVDDIDRLMVFLGEETGIPDLYAVVGTTREQLAERYRAAYREDVR